jgi:hypothetical protein
MLTRRDLLALFPAAALGLWPHNIFAQNFPTGLVRIIVPLA